MSRKTNGPVDPILSKRARGARRKGSSAQRDVAKLLGLWFFADDQSFHSSPASGGLRWKTSVAQTRGDIICSADQNFPYSIEVKNQERGEWDLLSMLFYEGPILNKWWKQCVEDADAMGKLPWLVFTRNQVPFISIIKDLDSNYLRVRSRPDFKFGDLYITPLANLLSCNPKYPIDELEQLSPKIIQRHIINPLKRIDAKE